MSEQATFHPKDCRCLACVANRLNSLKPSKPLPATSLLPTKEPPGSVKCEKPPWDNTSEGKVVQKCPMPPYTEYSRSLPANNQRDLDTLALVLNLLFPHDFKIQRDIWLYVVNLMEQVELDAIGR